MVEAVYYKSYSYLFFIFIIFILFYVYKSTTNYLRNLLFLFTLNKIDFVFTTEIFKQILALPYPYYRNHPTGDIVSRISDLHQIKDMIGKVLITVFIDFILSFCSLFFLYKIHKSFFILCLFCSGCFLICSVFFSKILHFKIKTVQNENAMETSFLVESISGFESIKGMHFENSIFAYFEKKKLGFLKNKLSLDKTHVTLFFIEDFLKSIGYVLFVYMGANFMMKGILSSGLFFLSIELFHYFLEPYQQFLNHILLYKETLSASERISFLFRKQKELGFVQNVMIGSIEVKKLSYLYEQTVILKNISFSISAGSKVLILGKSGVGKSTFLKILKKYYTIEPETVFIDRIDLTHYTQDEINRSIGYLSQNETLFTGSLYHNLTMYQTCNPKFLNEVIQICELESILKKSNLGLSQMIEENGFNLSGGEKQRILLGRLLLQNFRILLIDEGLNQMDVSLERRILKRIFQMHFTKTILVVSHRLDNMDLYDQILWFKQDKIVHIQKKENGKYLVIENN